MQIYFPEAPDRYQLRLLERKVRLTDADRMRQVMRVQHALQNGARARQADALELGAQDIDGAAVERVERVTARDGALSYERFLRREQCRVELALRRGELAVYGERPCCAWEELME